MDAGFSKSKIILSDQAHFTSMALLKCGFNKTAIQPMNYYNSITVREEMKRCIDEIHDCAERWWKVWTNVWHKNFPLYLIQIYSVDPIERVSREKNTGQDKYWSAKDEDRPIRALTKGSSLIQTTIKHRSSLPSSSLILSTLIFHVGWRKRCGRVRRVESMAALIKIYEFFPLPPLLAESHDVEWKKKKKKIGKRITDEM